MTTVIGRRAERAVAKWLLLQGYKIYKMNWRTRLCEIDIVASKEKRLYFVEVKYRSSSKWGTGLDYITPQKHQQMSFAASMFMAKHKVNCASVLCVASVSSDMAVTDFIELTN